MRVKISHTCVFARANPRVSSPFWQPLTEKLDIYSMGNIFWAMFGRDPPFPRDEYYKNRVLDGERPEVHPSWHPEFVKVGKNLYRDIL